MNCKYKVIGVIPARMEASRFPGKPLCLIMGKPMIWHVWQRSLLTKVLDKIVIATCDREIEERAVDFGAEVIMTSSEHKISNDRVAEVAEKISCDIILNIQGDEPLVNPQLINDVVLTMRKYPDIQCINPVSEIETEEEMESPHTVKVVNDLKGRVLYLSRYPIPSDLVYKREYPVYRQVPILGYRSDFCIKLQKLKRGPLECQEGIDLLRAIENDMPLQIMKTQYQTIGVDIIDNLYEVEKVMENDLVYQRY